MSTGSDHFFFFLFFSPAVLSQDFPALPHYDPVSKKGQMLSDWHCTVIGILALCVCVCVWKSIGKGRGSFWLFPLRGKKKKKQKHPPLWLGVVAGQFPVPGQWVYCTLCLSRLPLPNVKWPFQLKQKFHSYNNNRIVSQRTCLIIF